MSDGRLVIDVIDNGGQWTHREWRMLRYLGVDTKILPNNTAVENLRELDLEYNKLKEVPEELKNMKNMAL